ncbi:RNA recognition motif domain [Dillenia turbinata]|uniref:RNA recognition motif domain n=1 Tax=Dillenia turbinata TaxID=194707 RepID=A0AAN8VE60_9MAGN
MGCLEHVAVKIVTDKRWGQPVGFAYVWFSSEGSAQLALNEMDGKFVNERLIYVTIARRGSCKTRKTNHFDSLRNARVRSMVRSLKPLQTELRATSMARTYVREIEADLRIYEELPFLAPFVKHNASDKDLACLGGVQAMPNSSGLEPLMIAGYLFQRLEGRQLVIGTKRWEK